MSDQSTTTDQMREWAKGRAEPFTPKQAFESIDDIEDMSQIYFAISGLFKQGELHRKKAPTGNGYEYIWHKRGGAGYEAHAGHKVNGSKTKPIAAPAEQMPQPGRNPDPTHPKPPAPPGPPSTADILQIGHNHTPEAQTEPETPARIYNADAIADALIARLKPLLTAQFHAAKLSESLSGEARAHIRIEKLEITLEGL